MKRSLLLSFFILLACARSLAQSSPVSVDFTANKQVICPGDSVHFTSTITGTYTSVLWAFPGGSPSSSTSLNPAVAYNTPGTFAVTFSARNATDTGTKTKTAYITVSRGQTLAVSEGFETTTFPPSGWQLVKASTNNWALASNAGGFGTSTHSVTYNNYTFDAQGLRDRIIAPKVDLTGVTGARLTFNVAYSVYSTGFPDSLQVRVSADCGNTWTVVYSKTGAALATAPSTTGLFVPTASQWRSDTVSLNAFVNNPILVSFDNIGHYGQAIYLDNINILPAPRAVFGTDDTAVCVGNPVLFSDFSPNATAWSWSFPGGTPSSSNAQNPIVTYSTGGTYSVTLTASNGAGTGVSTHTNYIRVSSLSGISIVRTGFILNATGGTGTYQWFLNGSAIPGATSSTLLTGTTGIYTVSVRNGGCSGTSAPYYYVTLAVGSTPNASGFTIFPNPSTGQVTINAEGITAKQVTVQCYNVAGQLVRSELMQVNNGTATSTYDWSTLAKGIYELRLITPEKSTHTTLQLQ